MNQYFIKKYIDKLTIDDILTFSNSQQVQLNKDEACYILKTIKQNYQELLYGDPKPTFNRLKDHVSNETYTIALELYHFYKEKYQSFL